MGEIREILIKELRELYSTELSSYHNDLERRGNETILEEIRLSFIEHIDVLNERLNMNISYIDIF